MRAALLLQCDDRPGIVAAVGAFVAGLGGNVVEADQHSDPAANLFLQRVEFDVDASIESLRSGFEPLAQQFAMEWSLHDLATRPRIAVLASRQGHCLADLLVRDALGELPGRIVLVASNHETHATLAARFDVEFHHLPVGDDRDAQERALGLVARSHRARRCRARALHARAAGVVRERVGTPHAQHPSLVPAVVRGARPYAQAHERGVKVIGATAHYVTPDLDEGPIIAQQVLPVSHRDDPDRLERRGRDLEAVVLAEAVRLHLEHRVIVYGRRTAVFD